MIYDGVEELIGNTPLLRIPKNVHGLQNIDLFAKLEYYNPFGSIKDRIAWAMLKPSLDDLKVQKKTVIESSSGNTAKALAALCKVHGLDFEAVTNRIKYPEIRGVLQVLGAQVEELPGLSDCPHPFDPNDAIQVSKDKASRNPDKYHLTDQYFNPCNPEIHYAATGKEIVEDLGAVNYFFGFLGTCGSTLGIGRYLKEKSADTAIYGIVGQPGHSIPGGRSIEELWEVGFFSKDFYSDILSGTTAEAVDGMLILNRDCGILAGPTSGLAFIKAVETLKKIEQDCSNLNTRKQAVFIACDRMEPYLSFLKKHRSELFVGKTRARASVESLPLECLQKAQELSPQQMTELIADKDPYVIDIRGNFAFSTGHIPGSINILDDNFSQVIEGGAAFPKQRPIVVVCRVGDISKRYAAFLTTQGYEACSLRGGVQAYKNSGLELERSIGVECSAKVAALSGHGKDI